MCAHGADLHFAAQVVTPHHVVRAGTIDFRHRSVGDMLPKGMPPLVFTRDDWKQPSALAIKRNRPEELVPAIANQGVVNNNDAGDGAQVFIGNVGAV